MICLILNFPLKWGKIRTADPFTHWEMSEPTQIDGDDSMPPAAFNQHHATGRPMRIVAVRNANIEIRKSKRKVSHAMSMSPDIFRLFTLWYFIDFTDFCWFLPDYSENLSAWLQCSSRMQPWKVLPHLPPVLEVRDLQEVFPPLTLTSVGMDGSCVETWMLHKRYIDNHRYTWIHHRSIDP